MFDKKDVEDLEKFIIMINEKAEFNNMKTKDIVLMHYYFSRIDSLKSKLKESLTFEEIKED